MHELISKIRSEATASKKTIVLAEAEDIRVLQAAKLIEQEGIASLILVGNKALIKAIAKENAISLASPIVDPTSPEEDFSEELFVLRKHKGLSLDAATRLIKNPLYYAAFLVRKGIADGMVAGNKSATADTLRAAFQVVGSTKTAFSYFLLTKEHSSPFIFSDCALNIDPDAELLCDMALGCAREAKRFGIDPRIALLSYSSKGSAEGDSVSKMREAVNLILRAAPELLVDGELQFDAATVPSVASAKTPESVIAGSANVFLFPSLDAANIAYKITERLGGFSAVGPIIVGLNKPVNDLSRGCSYEDIVTVVAITALQC